jgi:hypothetical protein
VASRRYRTSRAAVLLRLIELYRRSGLRPGEALELGLVDPALPRETISGCFSKAELMALQDRLNPLHLTCLTEDKAVFYPLCEALGLPVPRTFAVVHREGGWTIGGTPVTGRGGWASQLAAILPQTFVAKPAAGVYGEGVSVWVRDGSGFRDQAGRRCSTGDLAEGLLHGSRYDRFVIQERLENHPALVALTGCPFLQTVRVATLVEPGQPPRVLYGEWKLIVGKNVVDNFMRGQTGNLVANVSVETGELGPARTPSPDGVGYLAVPSHPATGLPLAGFRLPGWEDLVHLALRSAWLFQPLRTIGWDVAVTPRGPVLVEGNRWWDPPNDAVIGPAAPGLARHEMIAAAARLRQAPPPAAP